jgi:hypothetical protein
VANEAIEELKIADLESERAVHASAMRMKARLVLFGFSLLFQPQDTRSYRVERLFGRLAKQRILMRVEAISVQSWGFKALRAAGKKSRSSIMM